MIFSTSTREGLDLNEKHKMRKKIKQKIRFFLVTYRIKTWSFNPLVFNAPFLYLLKTSEKGKVFSYFQELEKGCIGKKWVNKSIDNLIL